LTPDSPEVSLFAYSLPKAINLVDPLFANLLMVNSFNEWHEDSMIEPCVGGMTNQPTWMTNGVEYEGYGELYLDLLRNATLGVQVNNTPNVFGGAWHR